MANANKPSGLSPLEYLNGTPWNGQARMYCVPDTDDTNVYAIGDPVVLAGGADANGVPTITLATAGTANQITGVIVGSSGPVYGGASFDPNNLNSTVSPATKTRNYYFLVADDPNIVFEVQEIGTGTVFTAAEVGLNANLVAGTNNGYVSGWMVDNSGETTTATLQVKLLGLVQRANNAFGQYAKWRVLINNHTYRAGTTGT